MRGFGAFLAKERQETVRTWRIWVIPGMLVFFAITSPLVALVTPRLLASLASSTPGVLIQLPDPTAADAYGQFLKSLSQIVIIAVIIAGAGIVSSERSSGTAILVLTKPVSRTAFVLAKLVSTLTLVVTFTVIATLLCVAVARAIFPASALGPLFRAIGLWMVHAGLLVTVMTFFSVLLPSLAAAAGAGLGFLFLSLLLSIWPAAARYTFIGLPGAAGGALAGSPDPVAWPVVTALAAAAAFTLAAVELFKRQEL